MATAQNGSTVVINFTGRLEDGTLIDSTYPEHAHSCEDDDCQHDVGPYELTIGEGDFYLPVEEALVGMQVGERKTVTISPDDGFGDYDPEKVFTVDRGEFPAELSPEVGQGLEVTGEDDEVYIVTVIEVSDQEVSLDSNHPLAGEDLTYEVELVEIR